MGTLPPNAIRIDAKKTTNMKTRHLAVNLEKIGFGVQGGLPVHFLTTIYWGLYRGSIQKFRSMNGLIDELRY